jgi:hypothetical protein
MYANLYIQSMGQCKVCMIGTKLSQRCITNWDTPPPERIPASGTSKRATIIRSLIHTRMMCLVCRLQTERLKRERVRWEENGRSRSEYFLGMRVQQDLTLGTIRLSQHPYWEHVISCFNLEHVPLRNTPLPVGIILDSNMSPKTESERQQMANKPYRPILGSVMWGQLATHPDLSFLVSLLSCFQANPRIEHWKVLMHVVGYVKNTVDYGLTYLRDRDISSTAFADADYGGCRDTHRSTSGYVFIMSGGPVTWSSKRQATVALSTIEAKYVAISRCGQQMVWMQSWLDKVTIEHTKPGVLKGDSRGVIMLTKNTKDHGKIKHIDIRHHNIQELVKSGAILMEHVPSSENLADLFTKALSLATTTTASWTHSTFSETLTFMGEC